MRPLAYIAKIDHSPFGVGLESRKYKADTTYRFGFNGKETDAETDLQDYGMRIYNKRLCVFLSTDPIIGEYPWYSSYQFAGNNPIAYTDLDGLQPSVRRIQYQSRPAPLTTAYRVNQTARSNSSTVRRSTNSSNQPRQGRGNGTNNRVMAAPNSPQQQPTPRLVEDGRPDEGGQSTVNNNLKSQIDALIEGKDILRSIVVVFTDGGKYNLDTRTAMTTNPGVIVKFDAFSPQFKEFMALESQWQEGLQKEINAIPMPPPVDNKKPGDFERYNSAMAGRGIAVLRATQAYVAQYGKSPMERLKEVYEANKDQFITVKKDVIIDPAIYPAPPR